MGVNMNKEEYSLEGFIFSNQADYDIALDEWNTISYIKKNSELTNEIVVYKLYCKLIEKNAFKTVIGLSFHKELRVNLLKTGRYKEEDLKPIAVTANNENKVSKALVEDLKVLENKDSLRNAKIINIFLVVTILAMFVITIYT